MLWVGPYLNQYYWYTNPIYRYNNMTRVTYHLKINNQIKEYKRNCAHLYWSIQPNKTNKCFSIKSCCWIISNTAVRPKLRSFYLFNCPFYWEHGSFFYLLLFGTTTNSFWFPIARYLLCYFGRTVHRFFRDRQRRNKDPGCWPISDSGLCTRDEDPIFFPGSGSAGKIFRIRMRTEIEVKKKK